MSLLTVNIPELVSFFDDDLPVSKHASAVKAVMGEELGFALLTDYFRRSGADVEVGPALCSTGKSTGFRLDGWLHVTRVGTATLYQVEVKSWSRHSIGGRALSLSASGIEIRAFKIERWKHYWAGDRFCVDGLNKVLTPMEPPLTGIPVEPLACLWDAMHPTGEPEPFFTIDLTNGPFQRVNVFSMSSFLRSLNVKTLNLDLPATSERLNWLSRILSTPTAVNTSAAQAGRI